MGSRLRSLTEIVTEEARQVYSLYGNDLRAKWFPVFHLLSIHGEMSVSAIAKEIGHSHVSVSKIIAEMRKEDLVNERRDSRDKRKSLTSLTEKGHLLSGAMKEQYLDVEAAVETLLAQTQHDLWKAMEEFEFLLNEQSLLNRVQHQRKLRERKHLQIIPYSGKYAAAFHNLNKEWITEYFTMEPADYKALEHPEQSIIETGGHILIALYKNEPIGTCALCRNPDHIYEYELAKMAVKPELHGLGFGEALGEAIIEKARSLGAKEIYLESNTTMKAAISLYRKLGFNRVSGIPTPYDRCNIQMVLNLMQAPN